jgi:hypothetical protein
MAFAARGPSSGAVCGRGAAADRGRRLAGAARFCQDAQLAAQRVAEDREITADLIVAALTQRFSAIEHDLDATLRRGEFEPRAEPGAPVVVRIAGEGIRTTNAEKRALVTFLESLNSSL